MFSQNYFFIHWSGWSCLENVKTLTGNGYKYGTLDFYQVQPLILNIPKIKLNFSIQQDATYKISNSFKISVYKPNLLKYFWRKCCDMQKITKCCCKEECRSVCRIDSGCNKLLNQFIRIVETEKLQVGLQRNKGTINTFIRDSILM